MKPPDSLSGNPFSGDFTGGMLEDMEHLPNYNDWIVSMLAPALRGRAAEIGAGLRTFAERIRPHVDSLELVEPAPELAGRLTEKFAAEDGYRVMEQTLEDWLQAGMQAEFDSIVLVNVLEHIKDDRAAAEGFYRNLKAGGRLMIFVPAMPFLYSKLDFAYGHYRRYTRKTLRQRVAAAGFEIEMLRFVDFAGVLPWWLLNTVLGKTTFHAPSLRVYDKYFVPVTRSVESVLAPPVGKNLILIARKAGT